MFFSACLPNVHDHGCSSLEGAWKADRHNITCDIARLQRYSGTEEPQGNMTSELYQGDMTWEQSQGDMTWELISGRHDVGAIPGRHNMGATP